MSFAQLSQSQNIEDLIGRMSKSSKLRGLATAFNEIQRNDSSLQTVQHNGLATQHSPEMKILGDTLSQQQKTAIRTNYNSALEDIKKSNPSLYSSLMKNTDKIIIVPEVTLRAAVQQIAKENGQTFDPRGLIGFTMTTVDDAGKLNNTVLLSAEQFSTKAGGLMVLNHEARHVELNTSCITNKKPIPDSDSRERYAYTNTIKDLGKIETRWKAEHKSAAEIKAIEGAIASQKRELQGLK